MLGEVGMANESTKTRQTSMWMAQHNERTRLHDLSRAHLPTYVCTSHDPNPITLLTQIFSKVAKVLL